MALKAALRISADAVAGAEVRERARLSSRIAGPAGVALGVRRIREGAVPRSPPSPGRAVARTTPPMRPSCCRQPPSSGIFDSRLGRIQANTAIIATCLADEVADVGTQSRDAASCRPVADCNCPAELGIASCFAPQSSGRDACGAWYMVRRAAPPLSLRVEVPAELGQ